MFVNLERVKHECFLLFPADSRELMKFFLRNTVGASLEDELDAATAGGEEDEGQGARSASRGPSRGTRTCPYADDDLDPRVEERDELLYLEEIGLDQTVGRGARNQLGDGGTGQQHFVRGMACGSSLPAKRFSAWLYFAFWTSRIETSAAQLWWRTSIGGAAEVVLHP